MGLDGIQCLPLVDSRLTLLGDHELHVAYAGVHIEGSSILGEDLTSQAVTFPAGSYVESRLDLDIIRFDYRPHWLSLRLGGWSLIAEIGASIDPFRYRLESPTVAGRVDRSYTIGFPYAGVYLSGTLVGPLRAELEVCGMAGVAGVTFLDMDVRLVHPIIESPGFRASLVAGLKGTWLRRRDYQEPQYNDIEFLMGAFSTQPWAGFTTGLSAGF